MSMNSHSYQMNSSNKNYFSAHLKDENNNLLEIGLGSVSLENKSVDFFNEFVPLMKYRSPAKIVKLIGEQECHCFDGRVYLSSKSRLQLTDITDSFITGKELEIPQKIRLSAALTATNSASESSWVPIEVFCMSLEEIHFTMPKGFQPSRNLLLKASEVNTDGVVISIYKELKFSEEKTVCYANVVRCPIDCKKAIFDFLAPKLILFPAN